MNIKPIDNLPDHPFLTYFERSLLNELHELNHNLKHLKVYVEVAK